MKKVCVLMSTYNGEKYLKEQIDSILSQKNVEVELIVRDDGSTDNTINIIEHYKKNKKLKWFNGENLGPALSFLDLLYNSPEADYYAFSDQDDFWEENKLYEAIKVLELNNSLKGKLYFSTLNIVDENLNFIRKTTLPKNINIKNELIKNYATGCTMVFDTKLRNLIKNCKYKFIAMHDSYICRIALLSKAYIYLDNNSYINYRQHSNNVLGMKSNFFDVWKLRWNRFIHSECLSQKTAVDLLNNIKSINKEDYDYIMLVANYKSNLKYKLKLLKLNIFGKEEKINKYLFKIKLVFNKI